MEEGNGIEPSGAFNHRPGFQGLLPAIGCYPPIRLLHSNKYLKSTSLRYLCGEQNVVDVHHLDHNRSNNDPANLIPLCPTHHQYWHSKFRNLIEDQVRMYIESWSGQEESNLRPFRPKRNALPV
jgi:hypothetical protein